MRRKEGKILELETTLPLKYKLLIFLAVFSVIMIVFGVILETKCKIKQFNVTGNTWYSSEEITEALQTNYFDKYSVFLKLHYMFKSTPEMAFIDRISIKFESADTISVRVYEKNIVGCVYEMGDYLYFDKDGYVVSSRSEQMNNVPRIDGLAYKTLTVNKKLEVQSDDMFDVILDITQLIDKYEVAIDTIGFDENQNITLYCTDENQVYLGKRDSYDAVIQALPNILAAAEEKTAIYRLDMSEFTPTNTTISAEFIKNDNEEGNDNGSSEEAGGENSGGENGSGENGGAENGTDPDNRTDPEEGGAADPDN